MARLALRSRSYAFLALIACGALLAASGNGWTNALVLPLVLAPPVLIAWAVYRRWLRKHIDAPELPGQALGMPIGFADELVAAAFVGFGPGAALAMVAELVTSAVFVLLCFGPRLREIMEQLAKAQSDPSAEPSSADLGGGFAGVAFILLTSFVTAAGVEEVMKAAAVRAGCGCGLCCTQAPDPRPRQQAAKTVALLLAAGLGFSLVENMLYTFGGSAGDAEGGTGDAGGSDDAPGSGAEAGPTPGEAIAARAVLALLRGVVSMPVHALCAGFTGLRLTVRDIQRRQQAALLLQEAGGLAWANAGMPGASLPASTLLAAVLPPPPVVGGTGAAVSGALPAAPAAPAAPAPPVGSPGFPVGPAVPFAPVPFAAVPAFAPAPSPSVRVWSWPRVLLPAFLVHGSFDAAAMLFGGMRDSVAAAVLTTLSCVAVLAIGVWALVSQVKAAFDTIALGGVPERLTFAPACFPAACVRVGLVPRVLLELGWAAVYGLTHPAHPTGTPSGGYGRGYGGGYSGAGSAEAGAGSAAGPGGVVPWLPLPSPGHAVVSAPPFEVASLPFNSGISSGGPGPHSATGAPPAATAPAGPPGAHAVQVAGASAAEAEAEDATLLAHRAGS